MIRSFTPLFLILCIGCSSVSKTEHLNNISEDNKDVIVLAHLIRDHLRNTNGSHFSLPDMLKSDTLERVTKNFAIIDVGNWPNIWRGGYAVYFKFSDERNMDSIELLPSERIPWKLKTKKTIGRNNLQIDKNFDGEIHFHYPERHCQIAEIILKEPAN